MTIQPHPSDVRLQVRMATYSNQTAERDAITQVDRAVNDRVRAHEQYLVSEARRSMENSVVDEEAAGLIAQQLAEEVRYPLVDGGTPTADLAERYEALRNMAALAASSLHRAEKNSEFMAAKVADPYASLMELYDRFPMIRPSIR